MDQYIVLSILYAIPVKVLFHILRVITLPFVDENPSAIVSFRANA